MTCSCCQRESDYLTKHHLIPRTRHRNKIVRKKFTRDQLNTTINLCRPCHNQIHAIFTEKELERNYNSLETLTTHAEIIAFVEWIKDKPQHFKAPIRRKAGRNGNRTT